MELDYNKMQRAYSIQARGNNGKFFDMVILVDTNRELTQKDTSNIREYVQNIQDVIEEESIRIDPKSAIDAAKEKEDILNLFGDNKIFVEEIPNGYCSRYCCKHLPWFIVTTKAGRIKLGWRKRVIEIDWSDSICKTTAKELFPEENVTKGDFENPFYIHAWGLEKAQEYINNLLKL